MLSLATDLEGTEVLVPGALASVRLRFTPELELVHVTGADLPLAEPLRRRDGRDHRSPRLPGPSDRPCYPPASLPVSWTLKLVPLDQDRSPEALRPKAS
jgi:hypothetical protein